MSLGLKASADGLSVDLLLGATVLATFSASGVDAGTLIASDGDAQGLTNLKKLITPAQLAKAFQGANQSLGGGLANGYQKLPGGLILQWGSQDVGGAGSTPIVFPIAFPTAVISVMAGTRYAGSGTPSNLVAAAGTNVTLSGMTLGSTGAMSMSYLVFGK